MWVCLMKTKWQTSQFNRSIVSVKTMAIRITDTQYLKNVWIWQRFENVVACNLQTFPLVDTLICKITCPSAMCVTFEEVLYGKVGKPLYVGKVCYDMNVTRLVTCGLSFWSEFWMIYFWEAGRWEEGEHWKVSRHICMYSSSVWVWISSSFTCLPCHALSLESSLKTW